MASKFKRSRLLVEPSVQISLVRHVVFYWLCTVMTLELLNLSRQIAIGPERASFWAYLFNEDLLQALIRLGIGSLLVLPLVIWDMLKLSNRFAGPIYRMRRTLRSVAASGNVENVRLRDGDFWADFAEELNAALAQLDGQRKTPIEADDAPQLESATSCK
jgi:sensor histidine kinase YesM